MKYFINDKEYQRKEFAATILNLRFANFAEDDLSLLMMRAWIENTVNETQKTAIYNTMAEFEVNRIFERANHFTISGVHFNVKREEVSTKKETKND